MTIKAGYSTPMLHVADVERAIDFYRKLGFELIDVQPSTSPFGWARMHCEGGALMFLRAEEDGEPPQGGMLLYLYTPDLPGMREQLVAGGVGVADLDGNTILIGHWGDAEQQAWDRDRVVKREAGLIP
jgi:catechol 2,3-dioxygenase-like lactoylglutathione lyase family enzyme